MTGVIDVGGGTRGIYGAGVFDWCMDNGIKFDYCIGVSAGSANCVSYLAGQKGRNFAFYNEYAFRPEYMGWDNLRKTGSYINLDYIYTTLSAEGGENPVDYDAMKANPAGLEIVATDARTGKAVYFPKEEIRKDHYEFLKASCCVPIVNRPYPVGEGLYFDGGLADPIPIRRLLGKGCDRAVVILTRPKTAFRRPGKEPVWARILKHNYPEAAKVLRSRWQIYNTELQIALELERAGKALIIAPDSIGNLKTLTQDHAQLETLYEKGLKDAEKIGRFFEQT